MWWVTALLAASPAQACDTEKLAEIGPSLATAANDDLKRKKLMTALNAACSFPPRVADALRTMPTANAQDAFKLELSAVRQSPSEWTTACPAGSMAFERAATARGPQRAEALYVPCDLQRYRYATSQELAVAQGYVFLTVLVAHHFEEQRVEDRVGLSLLRTLSGIGDKPTAPTGATDLWSTARDAAGRAGSTAWDRLTAADAGSLLDLCEQVSHRPSPERIANKKVEFEVCAQAGRAADASGAQGSPYFADVQGQTVNVGYYAAATLANTDDNLLRTCTDEEIKGAVGWLVSQIRKGFLPPNR